MFFNIRVIRWGIGVYGKCGKKSKKRREIIWRERVKGVTLHSLLRNKATHIEILTIDKIQKRRDKEKEVPPGRGLEQGGMEMIPGTESLVTKDS